MPLLVDSLTVWNICFRWAGYDPDRPWLLLPLAVRDHFRNMIDAILNAELACDTLLLRKPESGNDLLNEMSIYRHLEDAHECVAGYRFNRKMLKGAVIERDAFRDWCEHRSIPLPEFWFPSGWNLEYALGEDEEHPGFRLARITRFDTDPPFDPRLLAAELEEQRASRSIKSEDSGKSASDDIGNRPRPNQEARITCQQIARKLWQESPEMTITAMVEHDLIRNYGGGKHFRPDTVRGWLQQVAPPEVSAKRGRPRKNGGESK